MTINKDFEKRLHLKNQFDGSLILGGKNFEENTGRSAFLKNKQGLGSIGEYIDDKTKLIQPQYVKERDCIICGSRNETLLFIKYGLKHVACKDCGFIFVNPILKAEFARKHYESEKDWTNVLLNETQIKFDRLKFQFGLNLIEEYFNKKGRLLDIGCGSGLFIKNAKKSGWDVTGIEFNNIFVDSLRKTGYRIYDEPLEKLDFPPQSFDCITLWEVLEHLDNAQEVLTQVYNLLRVGGILFILVPNIDNLSVSILQNKHNTFAPHSHINFFNHITLSKLLKKNKFSIEEVETIISEIGVIKDFLNAFKMKKKGKDNLSFITPEIIHRNLLGSKLITIAKKA